MDGKCRREADAEMKNEHVPQCAQNRGWPTCTCKEYMLISIRSAENQGGHTIMYHLYRAWCLERELDPLDDGNKREFIRLAFESI